MDQVGVVAESPVSRNGSQYSVEASRSCKFHQRRAEIEIKIMGPAASSSGSRRCYRSGRS